MKNNIIKDLSTITTIPEKAISKFYKNMLFVICDSINEAMLDESYKESDIIETDIGIGTLFIKRIGNDTKYHFTPNDIMKQAIEETFTTKENILKDFLSDTLAKKFIEVYKDLC